MIKGKVYFESNEKVKPTTIIYKHKHYNIKHMHSKYFIPKWYIIVNNIEDKIIKELIICDCWHPNAEGVEGPKEIFNPPKFSKFCVPQDLIGAVLVSNDLMKKYIRHEIKTPEYNVYSKNTIEEWILKVWAMDNPHHVPSRNFYISEPSLPKEVK